MKQTLLILAAPFDHYQGGSEYQYKTLEPFLAEDFEIKYLFRHPSVPEQSRYVTYDYLLRSRYHEHVYTDVPTLYRKLRQIDPDVIYKRGVNYITAVGVDYARRNGRASIVHIASERDLRPELSEGKIGGVLQSMVSRYALRHATRVVCQAEYQRDLLNQRFRRECDLVIGNVHPVPEQNGFSKSGRATVVWVGNLKGLKRPEAFLELASYLRDLPLVRFVMIGRPNTGRLFEAFLARLRSTPNVEYLGEQPIEVVNQTLSESHVFVNTSAYEGFPNTFVQAWMREVPVVSLEVDTDGLIATHKIGYVSGSVPRMAEHVRRLIGDESSRKDMGRRARLFACETFGHPNAIRFAEAVSRWANTRAADRTVGRNVHR